MMTNHVTLLLCQFIAHCYLSAFSPTMADIGDQRYKAYQSFCSAYRDYHRLLGKSAADVEKALAARWEALKTGKGADLAVVAEETRKLKDAATVYRSRSTLTHFFSKVKWRYLITGDLSAHFRQQHAPFQTRQKLQSRRLPFLQTTTSPRQTK